MRFSKRRAARNLVIAALLLLLSIGIGTRIGNRVVATNGKTDAAVVDMPTPVPDAVSSLAPVDAAWKKVKVMAVATDPSFPDPRVTPTPEPTPTPTVKPSPVSASSAKPNASTDGTDYAPQTPGPGQGPTSSSDPALPAPRPHAAASAHADELGE